MVVITVRRMAALVLFAAGCMSWTIGPAPDGGTSDAPSDRSADAAPFDCTGMLVKIQEARTATLSCSGTAGGPCPESIGPDECNCPVFAQADASTTFQDLVRAYGNGGCMALCGGVCPGPGGWECKGNPSACAP
jgi:hypothetical protein